MDAHFEAYENRLAEREDCLQHAENALVAIKTNQENASAEIFASNEWKLQLQKELEKLKQHVSESDSRSYKLESRLAQALTDCNGLSTASAELRAEKRNLEQRVRELEENLKNSVSAEKVQSLLAAAAERVSGICNGAQQTHQQLERSKRENKVLKEKLAQVPAQIEKHLAEEIRQRKRAEGKCRDAVSRADKMEKRLRELERSTLQLQAALDSAQEGIGVMKTIAKIRSTQVNDSRSIGFDAVAKKIEGVSRAVAERERIVLERANRQPKIKSSRPRKGPQRRF